MFNFLRGASTKDEGQTTSVAAATDPTSAAMCPPPSSSETLNAVAKPTTAEEVKEQKQQQGSLNPLDAATAPEIATAKPQQSGTSTSAQDTSTTDAVATSDVKESITSGETAKQTPATTAATEEQSTKTAKAAKVGKVSDPKNKPKLRGKETFKKVDHNKSPKKKTETSTTPSATIEEKKTSTTATSPAPVEQAASSSHDVHVKCKKTIALLNEEIQHWKSTVQKVSEEIQATNTLSVELKLAAIKGVCDEAEKKAFIRSDELGDSKRQFNRRGRGGRNQQARQDPSTTTSAQVSSQPQQQRRFQQQNANKQQQQHYQPNRALKSVLGVKYYHPSQQQIGDDRVNRMSHGPNRPMMMPQWNNHHQNQLPQMFNKQNSNMLPSTAQPRPRFNSHQQHQNRSPQHSSSNQQFNHANKSVSTQQAQQQQQLNNFTLLSSAAESDHPVCVRMREELRTANDVTSLTKLIEKAQAHKIQDLVDRGTRKLQKLHPTTSTE